MASEPVVVADAVHKSFGGVVALNGAGITVLPGEVHSLAGENGCGKSTLIKVISGVVRPDTGTVTIGGHAFAALTPRVALDLGVEVIYQDFSLLPNLSVAENIALPALATSRRRLVRNSSVAQIAEDAVGRLGVPLDLAARVEDLTVAEKQLTAIARSLAGDVKVIFLDEPTTALTWREVDALFGCVAALKQSGVAIVFVSHKLHEVLGISDRVTVMRNGAIAATGPARQFDRETLIRAMTGRDLIPAMKRRSHAAVDTPALEVHNLARSGLFADITFTLRAGEILGLTGLLGSGRTEIAEAIFGLVPADAGSICVAGQPRRVKSVADAVAAGIGYVPEDRLSQGLFLDQSIARNIIAADIRRRTGRFGQLKRPHIAADVARSIEDLRIKTRSPALPVRTLSGGNAQRVVLAKWLQRQPRVLILNSPTAGVDVGSKFDILAILRARSLDGMGILVISDDVPELVSICDRVLVIRHGRLVGELTDSELTEEALMAWMAA